MAVFILLYLGLVFTSYVVSTVWKPGPAFWAWHHFHNEPNISSIILFLGIAGLSLAIFALSRTHQMTLWVWVAHIGVLVGVAGLTWYFRLNHSWGDRQSLLELLIAGQYFRMSQPLTTTIWAVVYDIVEPWGLLPRDAVALATSIAAIIMTITLIRFLALFYKREALAISVLIVPSALIVLFFGYVEATALAFTAILLYFLMARRYIQFQVELWKPALALGTAIALHGFSAFLVPSLLYLGYRSLSDGVKSTNRRIQELLPAAATLILPSVLIITLALLNPARIRGAVYGDSLGGADLRPFVPLFAAEHENELYTLFSAAHFADLLNLMFLVSPLAFLALLLGARDGRQLISTVWGRFLVLGALSGLSFAFVWNADETMPKDWDLFGPALVPLLLLGAHVIARRANRVVFASILILSSASSTFYVRTYEPVKAWSPSLSGLPMPVMENQTDVVWDDNLQLLGFNLETTRDVSAGNKLTFELFFRGIKQMPVGYTVFLHLTDENGNLLAQDDHQPYPPTEYWPPGEVQKEVYEIEIPDNLESEEVINVQIGAYFWQTLERLELTHDGKSVDNNVASLMKLKF